MNTSCQIESSFILFKLLKLSVGYFYFPVYTVLFSKHFHCVPLSDQKRSSFSLTFMLPCFHMKMNEHDSLFTFRFQFENLANTTDPSTKKWENNNYWCHCFERLCIWCSHWRWPVSIGPNVHQRFWKSPFSYSTSWQW